jgi:hypothetical protein
MAGLVGDIGGRKQTRVRWRAFSIQPAKSEVPARPRAATCAAKVRGSNPLRSTRKSAQARVGSAYQETLEVYQRGLRESAATTSCYIACRQKVRRRLTYPGLTYRLPSLPYPYALSKRVGTHD